MMLVQTAPSPTSAICRASPSLRIAHEGGNDVGAQQTPHQTNTGPGGGSSICGKSSSNRESLASTANSDLGGAGSMINLSPSRA